MQCCFCYLTRCLRWAVAGAGWAAQWSDADTVFLVAPIDTPAFQQEEANKGTWGRQQASQDCTAGFLFNVILQNSHMIFFQLKCVCDWGLRLPIISICFLRSKLCFFFPKAYLKSQLLHKNLSSCSWPHTSLIPAAFHFNYSSPMQYTINISMPYYFPFNALFSKNVSVHWGLRLCCPLFCPQRTEHLARHIVMFRVIWGFQFGAAQIWN